MTLSQGTMPAQNPPHRWLTATLLIAILLALRLPNLTSQTIFCDEGTYLRWAQMVREDPLRNALVSMEDAKPPIHYWLLALTRPLASDPLYAGRLLSVIFAALSIPALLALGGQLQRFTRTPHLGPVAAAFFIACPLVAMNQRMALAEPLLLLESITLAWLSLRFAQRLAQGVPTRSLIMDALVLGFLWAATLLTKQNFSYLLWILPPAALAAMTDRSTWRARLKIFTALYGLATVIGLACFIPILFAPSPYDLRTRLFYKPMFTVTSLPISRATMIVQNLAEAFSARGPLVVYLTIPILALAACGMLCMTWRRAWPPLIFLGAWTAALLGSLLAGANMFYSRYFLLGAAPVLILAAWMAAELLRTSRPAWRIAALAVIAAVLVAPSGMTLTATRDFSAATLTAPDRDQYIDTRGPLIEGAITWLKAEAAIRPITIITGVGLGMQNDMIWLALRHTPNIQLLCDDALPPLQPAANGVVLAGTEQWSRQRFAIHLAPDRPIYYIAVGRPSRSIAVEYLPQPERLGTNTRLAAELRAPIPQPNAAPAIAIFQLSQRTPAQASASPR